MMILNKTIPKSKGTYALVLNLRQDKPITIGRLGNFLFKRGYYVYVGSALGPGGIAGRITHHIKTASRPHWHIDYFRQYAEIVEIWYQEGIKDMEHAWAEQLEKLYFVAAPVKGFGSSDCPCNAHFFHITANAI